MAFHLTGLADVAAHLTDPRFKGVYDGTQVHEPDVNRVLSRAWDYGLDRIIIAGTTLKSSRKALALAKTDKRLWCTVGCHPTRCRQMHKLPDLYPRQLSELADSSRRVVAMGECGLDFRPSGLSACKKKLQIKYFKWQVQLSYHHKKPMLLYCREGFDEMMTVLGRYYKKLRGGVIHSFVGSAVEAREFIRKGFYIGISGCSLKTAENLEVIKSLPLNRILLGTSAPYCDMEKPHAGSKYIKTKFFTAKKGKGSPDGIVLGRTEPAHVLNLTEIVAALRKLDPQELTDIVKGNVERVFFTKPEKETIY